METFLHFLKDHEAIATWVGLLIMIYTAFKPRKSEQDK